MSARWLGALVLAGCAAAQRAPAPRADLATIAGAFDGLASHDLGGDESGPDLDGPEDLASPPLHDLASPPLHDLAIPPRDLASPPGPCALTLDGAWCGESLPGGAAAWLYQCASGAIATKAQCPHGCLVNAPGTNDSCRTTAADPCASASSGGGAYCGQSLTGGDFGWLYQCAGGATTAKSPCPTACHQNPPGVSDNCT